MILALVKEFIPQSWLLRAGIFFYTGCLFSVGSLEIFLSGKGLPAEALNFYQEFSFFSPQMRQLSENSPNYYTMGPKLSL